MTKKIRIRFKNKSIRFSRLIKLANEYIPIGKKSTPEFDLNDYLRILDFMKFLEKRTNGSVRKSQRNYKTQEIKND